MENILISLNTVLPVFLVIGLGCMIHRLHLASDSAIKEMNTLSFKLLMPILLFYNIYTSDLSKAFDAKLIGLCLVGVMAQFLLGLLLIPRIEPSNPARGVMVQAAFRSNVLLLGIPIVTSLFGADQTGPVAMAATFTIPLFNVLAVISLELFRSSTLRLGGVARGVLTNPLVIGSVVGVLFVALKIQLPLPIETAVKNISSAASPLALVLMGASLNFGRLKSSIRNLIICVVNRLVLMPAIFIGLGAWMGFSGPSLCAVLITFGAPTAVNSYNMALQMDGDADLAGGIILATTACSCVTLFLWVWLLKTLGLF